MLIMFINFFFISLIQIQELELSEFGKKLPKYILSEEANTFKCTLCNIFATSLLQVKSHVDGELYVANKYFSSFTILKCLHFTFVTGAKHKNKVKNISQEKGKFK